ncbi:uncharacterized protein BDZ99DRAFT_462511 [Mytilinidion resinicola]|uniref:Uncharacterized protein n=1 Tax=Mytilinidion resinicola TaxID=574789 RepID=A0A6A6YTC8_9PEZI|nr:uncharacterized protein BDZ99DRAFT_462511 [Mytilinidion resinicola]KAF2811284.1 hypothetical protein BDZ99DRAFT_462511 [Mytilinidion resinicola]
MPRRPSKDSARDYRTAVNHAERSIRRATEETPRPCIQDVSPQIDILTVSSALCCLFQAARVTMTQRLPADLDSSLMRCESATLNPHSHLNYDSIGRCIGQRMQSDSHAHEHEVRCLNFQALKPRSCSFHLQACQTSRETLRLTTTQASRDSDPRLHFPSHQSRNPISFLFFSCLHLNNHRATVPSCPLVRSSFPSKRHDITICNPNKKHHAKWLCALSRQP